MDSCHSLGKEGAGRERDLRKPHFVRQVSLIQHENCMCPLSKVKLNMAAKLAFVTFVQLEER